MFHIQKAHVKKIITVVVVAADVGKEGSLTKCLYERDDVAPPTNLFQRLLQFLQLLLNDSVKFDSLPIDLQVI